MTTVNSPPPNTLGFWGILILWGTIFRFVNFVDEIQRKREFSKESNIHFLNPFAANSPAILTKF